MLNIRNFSWLIMLMVLSSAVYAQSNSINVNYKLYDSLKGIQMAGDTIYDPWAGGFNTPMFGKMDLNGDNKEDLIVFDAADNSITTLIYTGGLGQAKYKRNPKYEKYFPPCEHFFLLVDFNCDGKKDIFTQVSNTGITVFENITDMNVSPNLKFRKFTTFKDYYGNNVDYITTKAYNYRTNVFLNEGDLPVVDDIDMDGDLDILSFSVLGPTVDYYRNMAQEDHGRCDTLDFYLQSQCWGRFEEGSNSSDIFINRGDSTCDPKPTRSKRHAGSSMATIDLDGNGKKDLVLGDVGSSKLVSLYNTGSKKQALITYYDTAFPRQHPVDVPLMPAPFYIDANNDTRKDLIVAPIAQERGKDHNNIYYYRNSRSNHDPVFNFETSNFLGDQIFDVGTMAYPHLFDYNGDSLVDLLVGSSMRYDTTAYSSNLFLFENVGRPEEPAYQLVDTNYMRLDSLLLFGLAPTTGDLDNDGDLDLVVASQSGYVFYYENQAQNPGDPAVFVAKNHSVQTMSLPYRPIPVLYDLTGDSLLDFICGSGDGSLHFFENIGTKTNAVFDGSPSGHTDTLGGIVHQDRSGTGNLKPFFAYMDSSGRITKRDTATEKTYLFLGTNRGQVYIYDYVDRDSANLLDSMFLNTEDVSITGADLLNNDTLDLVFGNERGGLGFLLKNKGEIIPPKPEDTTDTNPGDTTGNVAVETINETENWSLQLFPNPTGGDLFIDFRAARDIIMTSLTIIDVNGRIMESTDLGTNYSNVLEWNVSHYPPGQYILRLEDHEGKDYSRTFIKQ